MRGPKYLRVYGLKFEISKENLKIALQSKRIAEFFWIIIREEIRKPKYSFFLAIAGFFFLSVNFTTASIIGGSEVIWTKIIIKEIRKVERIETPTDLNRIIDPTAKRLGYSANEYPQYWKGKPEEIAMLIMDDYAGRNCDRFFTYRHRPEGSPIRNGRISAKFGDPVNASAGGYSVSGDHEGVDFPAKAGTPVYATADGEVKIAHYYGAWGYTVVINHGVIDEKILITRYGHLESLPNVCAGDKVRRGDLIGRVGSTGCSTGNHLHYQIEKFDIGDKIPTDPKYYLPPELYI